MRRWLWWGIGLWLLGCQSSHQEETPAISTSPAFPPLDSIAPWSGEQLAYRYCQTCHAFPPPNLLPKSVWSGEVLLRMGHRLGIRASPQEPYRGLSMYESYILRKAGIFPDTLRITEEGWQKIIRYYEQHAPDSFPHQTLPEADTTLNLFRPHSFRLHSSIAPTTTLVHFDTVSNHLFVGDARRNLYELDTHHHILDSLSLDSPPSDLFVHTDGQKQVLTMGIMNPSDRILGKVWHLVPNGDSTRLLPENLRRPVHIASADLNQNGRADWVIAEFGNYLGELAWYEGQEDTTFRKHLLAADPGARRTEIVDLNQDGLPDIVALLTQGDERVVGFYNQGKGRFEPRVLLRFPPVYGSSYFELADFNHDGNIDILYTNGDNADYSAVLKPYHGIRIFLQQEGRFQEEYFFPMQGASKAMARDFDQDGDLDIAAISFFPDFGQTPERGFLYLENRSNATELRFQAATFPEATQGHWLTMDTGDTDQDGDPDLILGSFALPPSNAPAELKAYWAQRGPSFLILENTTLQ
ncbi:MAG: VCBS repeat-containing protein [Cyclobacteriaceae bacterium]